MVGLMGAPPALAPHRTEMPPIGRVVFHHAEVDEDAILGATLPRLRLNGGDVHRRGGPGAVAVGEDEPHRLRDFARVVHPHLELDEGHVRRLHHVGDDVFQIARTSDDPFGHVRRPGVHGNALQAQMYPEEHRGAQGRGEAEPWTKMERGAVVLDSLLPPGSRTVVVAGELDDVGFFGELVHRDVTASQTKLIEDCILDLLRPTTARKAGCPWHKGGAVPVLLLAEDVEGGSDVDRVLIRPGTWVAE
uniref:Uncharacterized protein n=1 Tax=Arundo donax TaxID=35708 RepID=A0A0A9FHG4_ARUDO